MVSGCDTQGNYFTFHKSLSGLANGGIGSSHNKIFSGGVGLWKLSTNLPFPVECGNPERNLFTKCMCQERLIWALNVLSISGVTCMQKREVQRKWRVPGTMSLRWCFYIGTIFIDRQIWNWPLLRTSALKPRLSVSSHNTDVQSAAVQNIFRSQKSCIFPGTSNTYFEWMLHKDHFKLT